MLRQLPVLEEQVWHWISFDVRMLIIFRCVIHKHSILLILLFRIKSCVLKIFLVCAFILIKLNNFDDLITFQLQFSSRR